MTQQWSAYNRYYRKIIQIRLYTKFVKVYPCLCSGWTADNTDTVSLKAEIYCNYARFVPPVRVSRIPLPHLSCMGLHKPLVPCFKSSVCPDRVLNSFWQPEKRVLYHCTIQPVNLQRNQKPNTFETDVHATCQSKLRKLELQDCRESYEAQHKNRLFMIITFTQWLLTR